MDRKTEYLSTRDVIPAAIDAASRIVVAAIANGQIRYDPQKMESVTSPMYELVSRIVQDARQIASMYYDKQDQ